jgi:uncharacterized integral membrane protein
MSETALSLQADWPWIVGGLVFLVFFAIFEYRGLAHWQRQHSLSRFVWIIGQKWPLSIALWGLVFGGLLVHFFWNWCPATTGTGG